MTTRWFCALIVISLACIELPGTASGKGGTNIHEPVRTAQPETPALPSEIIGGCGRGRYRDPQTHKCRGPADLP